MDIINEAKKVARNTKLHFRTDNMKYRITNAARSAVRWSVENADVVAVFAPVAIYGTKALFSGARNIHRTINLNKERQLKELYCYDRSLGHYWELRRKLSNREWCEVDRRKRNGEKLGDILKQMNVLR